MAPAAAGTKKRKSVTPMGGPPASAANLKVPQESRPVTRSTTTPACVVSDPCDALAFLGTATFEPKLHVPAFYRLTDSDYSCRVSAVKDRGAATTSEHDIVDFPNAFAVVDLNDRRGVWQNEPPLVKALGENPQKYLRDCAGPGGDPPRTPAGLKNLGATCYLNSLLQYLFFNVDFRQSLLGVSCESTVVRALQRVFALLAEGDRCTVDPSEFVTAASIDALEQADATEFSALLRDWLQGELGQSQEATHGSFIASLFEGEVSQVLHCMQNVGHTFERREHFYELRARLTPAVANSHVGSVDQPDGKEAASAPKPGKGKRQTAKAKSAPLPAVRLEHLLQETAFPDEILDGTNQYHCPRCDRKVDARKTTRLAKLPPYLHVTIERYHYDRHKGERRKLNRAVSFPRRLELRLRAPPLPPSADSPAPVETAVPVVYECVGYLEHVSDSAHSGHYTATLLQDDASTFGEALPYAAHDKADAVPGAAGAPSSRRPHADDQPIKRRRCEGADAAAGLPRRCTWWTLDDATVTAVNWSTDAGGASGSGEGMGAATAKSGECYTPDRIDSAAAYLVLYRRSDHAPGRLSTLPAGPPSAFSPLPEPFAACVAAANRSFSLERERFLKRSKVVQDFLVERRLAVNSLVQVLRQHPAEQLKPCSEACPAGMFSVVPSSWLNEFLHGEDRSLEDLDAGGDALLAPVSYGASLLRARDCPSRHVIDPLAVWCGEVKLVPTAALDALGGAGGLDESLFLKAEEALDVEACKSVWNLFQVWCQEQQQIAQILKDGKIPMTEARALDAQNRGGEAVWISLKVQNIWRKLARLPSCRNMSLLRADWQSFLAEVHRARWGSSSSSATVGNAAEDAEPTPGTAEGGDVESSATFTEGPEVCLLAGITCTHGLVSRPRAGFLARRTDIARLLETSSAKERLYREIWPEAHVVPRICSGLGGGRLLGFGSVCIYCQGEPGCSPAMSDETADLQSRTLTVRRRFSSGCNRKQGCIAIPLAREALTVTCADVKAACRERFGWPVARLLIPGPDGKDVELASDELVGESVEVVTIEKDESATEREGAAFEGSVFRRAPVHA